MRIKTFAATLTALAVLAGGSLASASSTYPNERPDTFKVVSEVAKKSVAAGTIFSGSELARRGLSADDIVRVSVLPSNGMIDPSSRGDL